MANENDYTTRVEIEMMKKDIGMISKLCEKFDATLEKLQQVASDLSRMISIQEQKMQGQDKINQEVDKVLDRHQRDFTEQVKALDVKVNNINSDLSDKIEDSQRSILKEINDLKQEITEKISTLEKWRWMVMGGITLAAFALSHLIKLYH